MLRHHILLAFRNFKRNKSSFFINLVGLSVGITCTILIFLWVNDELNVDNYHENDERLYQVLQNFDNSSGIRTLEWTPGPLARSLKDEIPEIEKGVSVFPPGTSPWPCLSATKESRFKSRAKFASSEFFEVFSYSILQGEKSALLADRRSVVISDELAKKLFNSATGVIGETFIWEEGEFAGTYLISGVFKKVPKNSSIHFDLVFHIDVLKSARPDLNRWDYNDPCTYILLSEGSDPGLVSQKISDFTQKKSPQAQGQLILRKYSDQYLYSNYENGVVAGGRILYVRIFGIIAVFILVIACINFMNLYTARASKRFKEVGIKKTIGANRQSLIGQYLIESLSITTISTLLAIAFVLLILHPFNQLTGKELSFDSRPEIFLFVIAIILIASLISGSFPALYFSGLRPVLILKGNVNTSLSILWTRKGLVVFQFMLSVVFIVSVVVLYRQMDFLQSTNLGYEKAQVISFGNEGKEGQDLELLINEVRNIPGVINASSMSGNLLDGQHNTTPGLTWDGKDPENEISFADMKVDFEFFETLGIEFAGGRSFSNNMNNERDKIILNQFAVEQMQLEDPIGRIVNLWGRDMQIIGVAKDFHISSLYEEVPPTFFRLYPTNQNILVKIQAGAEKETLDRIQDFYMKSMDGLQFEYSFLDNEYASFYKSEQTVSILSRYFAGLAILISCMGLFGLASFTAEQRRKEISIRKVLGSSELAIIRILTNEFSTIVLVAILIGIPVSYYMADQWLQTFVYRIHLSWWYFALAGIVTFLVAWSTVGFQTIKAALVNPAKILRSE